jgi:hypothetical protein
MTQQGRRRRKRRPDYTPPPRRGQSSAEPAAKVEAPRRRRGRRERPPAPWGGFPLVELVVLVAIGMVIVGFVMQGTRGGTFIVLGLALGSLAGLELSIREHFAGHKSHTLVLAATPAVIIIGLGLFLAPAGWPRGAALVAAVLTFVLVSYLLREAFKKRSGGLGFR